MLKKTQNPQQTRYRRELPDKGHLQKTITDNIKVIVIETD